MKVYIAHSRFHAENKYQRIQSVIDYVNQLLGGLYEYAEIHPQAMETYFIDYYLAQVENGGFEQFFRNSRFSEDINQYILNGLKNIGADQHYIIFQNSLNILKSLSKESLNNFLNDPYNELLDEALTPILSSLNELDSKFYSCPQSLLDINYEYIGKIKDVEILQDDNVQQKIKILLDNVPDYEERLEKQKKFEIENESPISKIAKALCTEYQQELISINSIDYGQDYVNEEKVLENSENGNFYCYLTTSMGFYYYIYNQGNNTANLYQGDTNQLIGTLICDDVLFGTRN